VSRCYSGGRYHAEEEQARNEQLGIWAGRFDMPEQWRHRIRAAANAGSHEFFESAKATLYLGPPVLPDT
jgi:hypothetical protein